jgi:NTP pyrophosphatase (non-canonical NTP hydrolase)
MQLNEIQKFCRDLLSRVSYPRVGTIIGLQEELGKLAEVIMDIEIYGKPFDKNRIEKKCSEVFFSFIDLCNSYGIKLDEISKDRIEEMKDKIKRWEKEHGETLKEKRKKFN